MARQDPYPEEWTEEEPPPPAPTPLPKTPVPSEWLRDDFRAYWAKTFPNSPWDPESWVNDPGMVNFVNQALRDMFFHVDPDPPPEPVPPTPEPPPVVTPPVVTPAPKTPYSEDALKALLRRYPATNAGMRKAFAEIKALGWNVSLLEHPTRLDKIRLPDGRIIDVIIGATGTSGEWGWLEGEGEEGGDYTGQDLEEPYLGQITVPPGWQAPAAGMQSYDPRSAEYALPPVPVLDLPQYEAPAPLVAPEPLPAYEAPAPLVSPEPFEFAGYEGAQPFEFPDWVPPEEFEAPSYEAAMSDPGFQFRLKQGQLALERSAAAKGTLLTGGTLKGLMDYSQELAGEEYGQVYGRAADVYNKGYTSSLSEFEKNYGKAAGSYATNEELRAEAYDRSRSNAFENYLANWGITSDVYGTNVGVGQQSYQNAYQKYLADWGITSDVYGTNVGVGQQTYQNAYERALAQYAPKLDEWQTQANLIPQQGQLDYNRAWNEYLTAYDIFKENQDRPFKKLYELTYPPGWND